jgi:polyphosphate kinase
LADGRFGLPRAEKIKAAPKALHDFVLEKIEREIDHAKSGKPASIFGKVNALVDDEVIRTLYRASQAGVKVDLIVRGVCGLRPGVPGVSDNIHVTSIVGRFLEHSIYRFENGAPGILSGELRLMARNFFRRVETCFPVENPELCAQIDQILDIYWKDNVKAREEGPEHTYLRRAPEGERVDAQDLFREHARKRKQPEVAAKSLVAKTLGKGKEAIQREQKVGQPA